MEKMNITIEFCIFELVLVPNLSLDCQFSFFGPNLPKNVYFRLKTEEMNTTIESCIFELVSGSYF